MNEERTGKCLLQVEHIRSHETKDLKLVFVVSSLFGLCVRV